MVAFLFVYYLVRDSLLGISGYNLYCSVVCEILLQQLLPGFDSYKLICLVTGGTVSKEHYITFNSKVLTEERLEKDLRIKLKDLKTALGV